MDYVSSGWILVLVILLVSTMLVIQIIIQYIDHKPPGSQSLFDCVMRDTLLLMKIYGGVYWTLAILSRIDILNSLIGKNLMLSTYGCCIFSLAFTCIGSHIACMCFVRIICLTNLQFLEESVGESNVRIIAWMFTCLVGVGVMVTLALTGDVRTGTIFILLTNQIVPVGYLKSLISRLMYTIDVFALTFTQICIEWHKYQLKKQSIVIILKKDVNGREKLKENKKKLVEKHDKSKVPSSPTTSKRSDTLMFKTGVITFLISSAMVSLYVANSYLAGKKMSPIYYLTEYVASGFVFLLVVPSILVVNNNRVFNYAQHRFFDSVTGRRCKVSFIDRPIANQP